MKVTLDYKKNVKKVHKEIPNNEVDAESVGLAIIKGYKNRNIFINTILNIIREKEAIHKFWLEIFNSLSRIGQPIETIEIPPNDWKEVDFHPDIETIKKLILKGVIR